MYDIRLLVQQYFGKRTDDNYARIGRHQVPIEGPLVRIGRDILLHEDDRLTETSAVKIATVHRICSLMS